MEQIKAMLEAMKNDAAFSEEMLALMKNGNAGEIIGLAEKKGFVFAETDWQAYVDWSKAFSAKYESKELSPEELDKISGGSNSFISGCWFHAASEPEFRDGAMRRRCNQYMCSTFTFEKAWAECYCWRTYNCRDYWHVLPADSPIGCG